MGCKVSLFIIKVKDIINLKGYLKEFLHIKESKTRRQAKIYLNDTVKEALNYYLDKTKGIDPDSFLFKSERSNKKIDRVRVWDLIQKWVKEAGLEGERYGTHSLRKTWAIRQECRVYLLARSKTNLAINLRL
jgi:site-specific recombinase XerD